jgi:hypothetical protein
MQIISSRWAIVAAYILVVTILYLEWVGWLADALLIWAAYGLFFLLCFIVFIQKGFTWALVPALAVVSLPFLSRLYSLIFL